MAYNQADGYNVSVAGGVNSSGAFISSDSLVNGTSGSIVNSFGYFVSGDSTINGVSDLVVSSSGLFVSDNSEVSGLSGLTVNSFGEFVSSDSVITGSSVPFTGSSGAFVSGNSIVTGFADPVIGSLGVFVSGNSVTSGLSGLAITSSGAFVSGDSVINGFSVEPVNSFGAFVSTNSIIIGTDIPSDLFSFKLASVTFNKDRLTVSINNGIDNLGQIIRTRGDTDPTIAVLGVNGSPVDLSTISTVQLAYLRTPTETIIIDGVKNPDDSTGMVAFNFNEDAASIAGNFNFDIQVVYTDGIKQTFIQGEITFKDDVNKT